MKAFNPKRDTLPIIRNLSVYISLALASVASQALTLGNVRGSVLVGRSVNVVVPVQLDAGEPASAVCTEVEIYFADNRLDASKVRSSWQSPEATGEGLLRIQSTVVVDEPVISVLLRAGCIRKTERRYVLLADMPEALSGTSAGTAESPTAPLSSGSKASAAAPNMAATAVKPAIRVPVLTAPSSAMPLATKAVSEPKLKSKVPKVPVKFATVVAPVAVPSEPPPAKSRLTLEALPEGIAGLKSTLELVAGPSENEQVRADARALWLSLNAQPADVLVDKQRLQAMDSQVKALQSTTAQSKADQDALKAKLATAAEDPYANAVVGVLAALLVCALASAGYLWVRMRRLRFGSDKDWWRGHSAEPSILSEIATHKESVRTPARGRDSRNSKLSRQPDVDLGIDESMFDSLISQTSSPSRKNPRHAAPVDSMLSRSGFQNSMLGSRSVNVEELFDIQQQAEFFVSLGQHDQAIELLRQHIYGSSSTSGLAYLDLLHLYHKFNRRPEYDQLRAEFNHSFNARVPPFDQFGHQNRGIERYPTAMSRIEAGWKTPEIVQILQDCIFRKPEVGDVETFDLEAYRELLLLFAITNEVNEVSLAVATAPRAPDLSQSRPQAATPVTALNLAPKSMVSDSTDTRHDVGSTHLSLPKPSPRLGLDVDLFELESVMSPLESLPELEPLDFTLSDPTPLDTPAPAPSSKIPLTSTSAKLSPLELDLSNYLADSTDMPLHPLTPPRSL
jgi:hypothetical protein